MKRKKIFEARDVFTCSHIISKPQRWLFGQGFVGSWNAPLVSFIRNLFDLPLRTLCICTYKVYLSIDAMVILVKR